MRSDFFYSQIVLRGGSLETCSSRGIFRRTDKLHVGFRPNLDGGGVTAGALDSLIYFLDAATAESRAEDDRR